MYTYIPEYKEMYREALENQVLLFSLIYAVPEPRKKYFSPFREDSNPGCFFSFYNGKVYFVDFADTKRTHRDIFSFTQDLYNISFKQAILLLYETLIYNGVASNPNPVKIETKKKKNRSVNIQIKERYFRDIDVKFWKQYGLNLGDLVRNGNFEIKPIKYYILNNRITHTKLSYAYIFESGIKIYSPYSKLKWIGNVKGDDVGYSGKHSDTIIFTKSVKDALLAKKLGYDYIFGQSEMTNPLIPNFVNKLRNYQKVIVAYDNDRTGRERGKMAYFRLKYRLSSSFSLLFTPKEKDLSDFAKKYGVNSLNYLIKAYDN